LDIRLLENYIVNNLYYNNVKDSWDKFDTRYNYNHM